MGVGPRAAGVPQQRHHKPRHRGLELVLPPPAAAARYARYGIHASEGFPKQDL